MLSDWPVPLPRDWEALVNEPQTSQEEEALRRCVVRGRPFGARIWVKRTAARLGLLSTLRPRGRPPKERPPAKNKRLKST